MSKRAKVIIAVVAVVVVIGVASGLGGRSGGDGQALSSSTSASSSQAAATVFGDPEVVDVMNGTGDKPIGTSANFYAAKADCTEENIAKWYGDYVEGSGHSWCTVVYSDQPDHGIYASGFIAVDVEQEKNGDGSYTFHETGDSTTYTYSDGVLKRF